MQHSAPSFREFSDRFRSLETTLSRELFREHRDQMRVKKEETAAENLRRIIDATLRLANRKGFQSMSLRDLSAETGLSAGGLYAYIRSKDDLVRLIQRHGVALTLRSLEDAIAAADGPRDKLRAAIRAHLFLTETMQPWFYFSYMEAKNLPRRETREAIRSEVAVEELFTGIIRAGQARGVFRNGDPQLLAGMIKALLQDWYLKRWKHRQRNVSVECYADAVQNMVEHAVLVPPYDEAPAAAHNATCEEG